MNTQKPSAKFLNAEDYGIAVKKGNDKLAADINKALNELKQNGEFDKIYNNGSAKPNNWFFYTGFFESFCCFNLYFRAIIF